MTALTTFSGRGLPCAACLGLPPAPLQKTAGLGRPGPRGQDALPSGSFYSAPQHMPRHPLQDGLFYVLQDYRASKGTGLTHSTRRFRQKALGIIAQIKDRTQ